MTEDKFTNTNGLIPLHKLAIEDADIPSLKVEGVTDYSPTVAVFTSRPRTSTANAGDYVGGHSRKPQRPQILQRNRLAPDKSRHGHSRASAHQRLQFLRINSTGGGLEFADVDFTAASSKNLYRRSGRRGWSRRTGKLPIAQLPDTFATRSFFFQQSGSIANGDM